MIRIRAGISFALTEAIDQGPCGLAAALLEIPPKLMNEALGLELADGAVVVDTHSREPALRVPVRGCTAPSRASSSGCGGWHVGRGTRGRGCVPVRARLQNARACPQLRIG
jgi:exodeoxyribonuclease V alpha subunit